jgi:cysteine desulfurase
LWRGIRDLHPAAYIIGDPEIRLPGHLCVALGGYENDAISLLMLLDEAGISVSTGSACSANKAGQPSQVLQAMGMDPLRAMGSLRITLGRSSTMEMVDQFLSVLARTLPRLRRVSSLR